MVSYRTGLARARGLGSAKHGVGQFITERVTAIALIPLVIWAVYSGLILSLAPYQDAVAWLRSPLHAVLLSLLIAVGFRHMQVGMRVVIEDYIHKPLGKSVFLLANLFVSAGGAAIAIFCVLKVAFGGAF